MSMFPGRRRQCDTPVAIADVLTEMLKSVGLEKALKEYSIISDWKAIVGEKIAGHAEPMEIKDGMLFLKVENSVWRNQLFSLKGEMLKKINQYAGKKIIRSIYYL